MKSLVKFLVIFSAFALLSHFSCGQEIGKKYEKEEKIKLEDFPKPALDLIEPILKIGKRTRFYKDYEKDTHFFEVKTIYKDQKLSIKFYKDGSLLDIEMLKEFDDLPKDIQEVIGKYFQSSYKKYRFTRIQIQYNREEEYEDNVLEIDEDDEYLEEFLEMDIEDLIIKYEFEAEVLNDSNERGLMEFLFNSEGQLEQVKKIFQRADDNVLY